VFEVPPLVPADPAATGPMPRNLTPAGAVPTGPTVTGPTVTGPTVTGPTVDPGAGMPTTPIRRRRTVALPEVFDLRDAAAAAGPPAGGPIDQPTLQLRAARRPTATAAVQVRPTPAPSDAPTLITRRVDPAATGAAAVGSVGEPAGDPPSRPGGPLDPPTGNPASSPPPSRRSRRAAAGRPDPRADARNGSGRSQQAPVAGPGIGAAEFTPGPVSGPAAEAAVKRNRAGRNLPMAIGVGVTLAGLVLASLLIRKEAFVGLVSAAAVIAVWELAGALSVRRLAVPVVPLAVGAVGMLVSAFVAGEDGLLVSFGLTAFGVLLWRLIDGAEGAVRDVTASVFAAAYVPFLAGFAMLLLAAPDGAMRVILFILVTVASDIGGYTAGVLWGRHPMAPKVSPKKSWEGFAGSALACALAGSLGVVFLLHGRWWAGAAVGAAAVVTATVGDLSESLIKRDLGIKDMGTLLPGHGGMLDRIDSLLVTAPVVYVLLSLLVPVS
jgi:phosphatidate cytidylyltransferase